MRDTMRSSEKFSGLSRLCRRQLYLNTYMNLTDNTEIQIDNCRKIVEYNDIYVKLITSTLTLEIWGEKLCISDYNTGGIIVSGKFSSIEFEREKNRNG